MATAKTVKKNVSFEETDTEIVVEVIQCLQKEKIARHFGNIYEICVTTYNWNKAQTKSALRDASQKRFYYRNNIQGHDYVSNSTI